MLSTLVAMSAGSKFPAGVSIQEIIDLRDSLLD